MEIFVTAFAFIIIFSALVLIHEWGHFFAARKAGIKVEEFGFGLPPRIWGVKKGETLYSINAIPFGGFVRLLGEDARDPKAAKDKRSFASKPARVRIIVIVAGVFMNFLLAWFLLTIGFTFGIQPMLVDGDAVLAGLNDGSIKTEQGVLIKEVKNLSPAAQANLQTGDRIVAVNGRDVSASISTEILKSELSVPEKSLTLQIERDGMMREYQLNNDKLGSGIVPYELMFLPRVVIANVSEGSQTDVAGVMPGDVLLQINGTPIYFIDDFYQALEGQRRLELMLLRDHDIVNTVVNLPDAGLVMVSSIFPDTPAETAKFMRGDVIVSIGGKAVSNPSEVVEITKKHPEEALQYIIHRGMEELNLTVAPNKDGLIGVGLSTLVSYENNQMSVYSADFPVSVLKIEDIRYPVWIAPFKALEESAKLSVVTVQMFTNVIGSIFTRFTVPEGVAGPVGIAQLTNTFVQEGILSLLRFMALLSLSLAIINVLPFPALDGGRLFFIIIEVVTGRKVGGKFEAWIHAIGFVILMILIFAVTYNDILRLL